MDVATPPFPVSLYQDRRDADPGEDEAGRMERFLCNLYRRCRGQLLSTGDLVPGGRWEARYVTRARALLDPDCTYLLPLKCSHQPLRCLVLAHRDTGPVPASLAGVYDRYSDRPVFPNDDGGPWTAWMLRPGDLYKELDLGRCRVLLVGEALRPEPATVVPTVEF